MQDKFITLFERLHHDISTQNIPHLQGFWVVHSDESLISQWLIDACRPAWHAHAQTIKRIELSAASSWQTVICELNSFGLFDDGSAIIVTGKHKPDATTLQALADIKNTPHHLIWCLPKQDKKSLATKAMSFFGTHGLIIDGNIYDERQRQQLLQYQARLLHISLTKDAWRLLMFHTQNNLLTAYQALTRLSLLHSQTSQAIDEKALLEGLVEGSVYSVFDLSDSILSGDAPKSLHILHHLQEQDVAASIVLWTLAKDCRLITQLHNHQSPQDLGIWRNKTTSYTQTARRTPPTLANQWLLDIVAIDKAIKGVLEFDEWHLMSCLVLSMATATPSSIRF